ncbi:kinase-like domain-containing protein [Absidia repens]|uniref:non-specific serine/threonine protein kinase n=1 Tax=Absidia repens TaxID=90262 RepID=A0A1X2I2P1_9FUNG|nr:kinase-like domain-containing protein [Absidia repens]
MQGKKSHLLQTIPSSSPSQQQPIANDLPHPSPPSSPTASTCHFSSEISTVVSPGDQFIFKKPVYNQHYHDTHFHHLVRHDSLFQGLKHRLFKRTNTTLSRSMIHSPTISNNNTTTTTSASRSSDSSSCSHSISDYSFGNEFNKDLEHRYGKWGAFVGKGSGGSVRVIRRNDSKLFAVKAFSPRKSDESERDYVKKVTAEFCIGSTLHHPNVIETLDIIQEEARFYEIMEYAPTDLFAVVMQTNMSVDAMACCWRQLLNGVAYLQDMGIAHRDLKLENVVMDHRHTVKIVDFGAAAVVRYPFDKVERLSSGVCGSDPYIAPEQYKGTYQAFKADLWSCGIIFVCMVLRRFAWRIPRARLDKNYELYLLNRNSLLAYIPRVARPTIAHLLDPTPARRWNMATLLADPWVNAIDCCTTTSTSTQHQHPPLPGDSPRSPRPRPPVSRSSLMSLL